MGNWETLFIYTYIYIYIYIYHISQVGDSCESNHRLLTLFSLETKGKFLTIGLFYEVLDKEYLGINKWPTCQIWHVSSWFGHLWQNVRSHVISIQFSKKFWQGKLIFHLSSYLSFCLSFHPIDSLSKRKRRKKNHIQEAANLTLWLAQK